MHKNNIAYLVALTMVAAATAPMTTAAPGSYDASEDTQAPVGIYAKDLGPLALAFCFLNETMPASCDPQPGAIPALGGAFFEIDSWNADAGAAASYGRHVRINVEQTSGQVLGGFAALACTDYNDDIECDSGSNGVSDDDCASGKDTKDCDNPSNLGLEFCAEKDDYTYTLIHDDGTIEEGLVDDLYDDFVVFVTAWVDVADDDAGGLDLFDNEGDNTGVGASFGQFTVYADWSGQTGFLDQAGCHALNDVVITHTGGSGNTQANYQGVATVVVDDGDNDDNNTVDQGVMECGATSGNGQGGFCIHDSSATAIKVVDDFEGEAVAFQVCRDNSGDGFCTDDETHFSHGNDGTFQNPVDVPSGTGQIVVFMCAGIHGAGGAHLHFATQGIGTVVPDMNPNLNGFTAADGFCGGGAQVNGDQVGKAYFIRPP